MIGSFVSSVLGGIYPLRNRQCLLTREKITAFGASPKCFCDVFLLGSKYGTITLKPSVPSQYCYLIVRVQDTPTLGLSAVDLRTFIFGFN